MNAPRPITTTTGTQLTNDQNLVSVFQSLPKYAFCTTVGLLAGTISTTLVILLAILAQSMSGPTTIFSLGLVPSGVVAALLGLAISWPMGLATYRLIPSLNHRHDERGMQIIITTGVLTGMLQIILFMFVL